MVEVELVIVELLVPLWTNCRKAEGSRNGLSASG